MLLQIMAVYHPHHVDIDKGGTLNGSRLGTGNVSLHIKKITPRDPYETTISTLKMSNTASDNGKD